VQGLGYACNAPRGVTLPKDVVRWEANCANNERQRARKQRRQLWSATRVTARMRGEETPSEPESSGDFDVEDEDNEEGEITPSSHSPPLVDLLLISVGVCQMRCLQMGTEASSVLPP
jgi:hypothetical protein